ncbi:MAG: elongation factor 1-beta [Theionarchaea archaeon]|nr:elongation factor 1-beta [Theionarchaea archaeon]MBU6999668.1 elongation factor 1-beta [Theionarchaea archaeon]MBU7022080.1 elongation factor 1-beta [Theionarchaea archaeon]MBU7035947.1 elongation factor 1-beta [Theionarchaea archaeon]MBU7040450.1 elongation factor 1-beta [Theionarchaea archaeon]
MYNLIATLRVLPEDTETDLGELEEAIRGLVPSNMELYKVEQEPIAFGLVALKIMVLTTDDASGSTDALESSIQDLDMVSQVEVTDVRRTLG